jgi:hypothetical protein
LHAIRYAQGGKKGKQKIFQPICGTSPQIRFKFFEFGFFEVFLTKQM